MDTRKHEVQDNTQIAKRTGMLKLRTICHGGPPWAFVSPGSLMRPLTPRSQEGWGKQGRDDLSGLNKKTLPQTR